jgi:hypothetical protein
MKNKTPEISKLAIACCSTAIISASYFPLSIVPIILGHMALSEHKKSPELKGKELSLVGISVGYGLLALGVLLHLGAYALFSGVELQINSTTK